MEHVIGQELIRIKPFFNNYGEVDTSYCSTPVIITNVLDGRYIIKYGVVENLILPRAACDNNWIPVEDIYKENKFTGKFVEIPVLGKFIIISKTKYHLVVKPESQDCQIILNCYEIDFDNLEIY